MGTSKIRLYSRFFLASLSSLVVGLAALGCSAPQDDAQSKAPPVSSSQAEGHKPTAPSSPKSAALDDSAASPAALAPPDSKGRFAVQESGMGPFTKEFVANEESVQAALSDCTVDYRREKGKATPHLVVQCPEGQEFEVLLLSSKKPGAFVLVLRRGKFQVQSGIGRGDTLGALASAIPSLQCEGISDKGIINQVFHRAYTRCFDPSLPQIEYRFLRKVFDLTNRSAEKDLELKVSELRWSP